MFFYLHFTRPPPQQALPSQPLSITPTISNDLRTEYLDEETDIYYAWVKSENPSSENNCKSLGAMTSPLTLTTWRKANVYKEVNVFPPKNAREGEYWQLLLCTKSGNKPVASVDMAQPAFGKTVFPILSMPILFSARSIRHASHGKLSEAKQVQNERILKLPSLWGTSGGPLRVTEHLSYDLDKKVWDSGIGLSHWLITTISGSNERPSIATKLLESTSPSILELGSGTGLVSLVLSTLLAHSPAKPQASVVATDLPSAMEILNKNIDYNSHLYPTVRPQAIVLDWDNEILPAEIQSGVDFIIMTDVTYNTGSFPSLVSTLARLSELPNGPQAVLLAYKERDPDERVLWGMCLDIGLRLEEIGKIEGAGGNPIEIYAGQFQRVRESGHIVGR